MDELVIAGRAFESRLIVGTGKYKDASETERAIDASGRAGDDVENDGRVHRGQLAAIEAGETLDDCIETSADLVDGRFFVKLARHVAKYPR